MLPLKANHDEAYYCALLSTNMTLFTREHFYFLRRYFMIIANALPH